MLDLMAALAIQKARDKGLYQGGQSGHHDNKQGHRTMHVKDKVCVVTGGASGIGEAVARAYAEARRAAWWSPTSRPRATGSPASPAISTGSRSPPMSGSKRTSRR